MTLAPARTLTLTPTPTLIPTLTLALTLTSTLTPTCAVTLTLTRSLTPRSTALRLHHFVTRSASECRRKKGDQSQPGSGAQ